MHTKIDLPLLPLRDIVIFPSFVIHRASKQKTNDIKLIISFNIEFKDIDPILFNKIDSLKSERIW